MFDFDELEEKEEKEEKEVKVETTSVASMTKVTATADKARDLWGTKPKAQGIALCVLQGFGQSRGSPGAQAVRVLFS
eukprot:Skav217095  [mRNA]  locus=scaffold187:138510:139232:+ [translate_table: standard]